MADLARDHFLLRFALASIFSVLHLRSLLSEATLDGGLTVDLIHRDSPESPYYNPAETPSQRSSRATHRSLSRARDLALAARPDIEPVATVFPNPLAGQYLMNISIGTPPVQIVGVMDTACNLVWTQCKPCYVCFEQIYPLFNPSTSSTYRDVFCDAKECTLVPRAICDPVQLKKCLYFYYYRKSFTRGYIARETVTLGSDSSSPFVLPQTIIGCGHNSIGRDFNKQVSGIIGLGGGPVSLISQMGQAASGKFSYCLVSGSSTKSSSKLNFGSNAVVSGPGTVSTPLATHGYYYLTLKAVSISYNRIEFENTSSLPLSSKGNILIDSGTTLTFVPRGFYLQLESAITRFIKLERVPDPDHIHSLCYKSATEISAPTATIHFAGADIRLSSYHTFPRVSPEIVCFSFIPNPDKVSIYGSQMQVNFLIGYDIPRNVISFKPTDCTSFKM